MSTEPEDGSIRTEIAIGVSGCPVAAASDETEGRIKEVNKSLPSGDKGKVIEEFSLDSNEELSQEGMEKIFDLRSRSLYRFERDADEGCVCDSIENFGCPVSEVDADKGTLYVTFYAPSIERVKSIMDELNENFSGVRIQELVRSGEDSAEDLILLNRDRLTDRQREVMKKAYEMGYFDHGEGANAGEVAEELGISPSTFTEHVSLAQNKILKKYLEG